MSYALCAEEEQIRKRMLEMRAAGATELEIEAENKYLRNLFHYEISRFYENQDLDDSYDEKIRTGRR